MPDLIENTMSAVMSLIMGWRIGCRVIGAAGHSERSAAGDSLQPERRRLTAILLVSGLLDLRNMAVVTAGITVQTPRTKGPAPGCSRRSFRARMFQVLRRAVKAGGSLAGKDSSLASSTASHGSSGCAAMSRRRPAAFSAPTSWRNR